MRPFAHAILSFLVIPSAMGGLHGQTPTLTVRGPVTPVASRTLDSPTAVAVAPVTLRDVTASCAALSQDPDLALLATDFDARRPDGRTVDLSWRLEESEDDFSWTLERRLNVEPAFTVRRELPTALLLRKRYVDPNDYAGTTYYRLRGVTPDGYEHYSDIRAVDNGYRSSELLVYPNPLSRSGTVAVPGTERPFELRLADQYGRTVWRQQHPARTDERLPLALPELPAGLYLLQWVVEDAVRATSRLVLVR